MVQIYGTLGPACSDTETLTRLFAAGMERARRMGAETVFLSAVPTEETVAFYFAMGCEDAEEVVPKFVDTPDDRYLRFSLSTESRRDER